MIRHIPNTLTSLNLVCGSVAAYFAALGHLSYALLFMVCGLIFDFFDGFSARLLGVSSPIGKELDSLADVVTFGVVPALMIFDLLGSQVKCDMQCSLGLPNIVPYFAFAIAAFSAIRLAKFNLDTRQSHSFIGLPTPANALFWAGLTTYLQSSPLQQVSTPVIVAVALVLIFCSSWIMVSEVPMFALKFQHFRWHGNEVRYGFLLLAAVVVIAGLVLQTYTLALSLLIVLYVLISLFVREKD